MSSSGINTLTTGTINGLNSLALDELTTTTMNAATIDGGIIYYDRIEGNEIIVDTTLTLTSTGVIAVGDKLISDIELTYLDGVNDNIQYQLDILTNSVNNNNSLAGTVAKNTTDIEAIKVVNTTQTNQITALQAKDVTHTNQIGELQDETADLYSSYNVVFAQLGVVQDKTYFQTRTSTATIFSTQVNIPNGNIGFYNSLLPNNFYIQSNLASGNNIVLNSGLANIFLQSQNVYLGKSDATTGRKSNLYFYTSSGMEYEVQSSAFTENLKQVLIDNAYSDMQQNIKITALETSDANQNTALTNHSSQIAVLQTSDTNQNITIAFHTTQINEIYEIYEVLFDRTRYITSNTTTATTNFNSPININRNNLATPLIGSIGAFTVGSPNDTTFSINGNGNNNLRIQSFNGEVILDGFACELNFNDIQLGKGSETGSINISARSQNLTFDNNNSLNFNASNTVITTSPSVQMMTPVLLIGSTTPWITGKYSNIGFFNSTGTEFEYQSSAFTEDLKSLITSTQSKTQHQSTTVSSTNFANQVNLPNGNIGVVNSTLPNNFYIQSNLAVGNDIVINSGSANTYLQSQNVYLGNLNASGRKSKLYMVSDDDSTWEVQVSAFTEVLKLQILNNVIDIIDLKSEQTTQNQAITAIQSVNTTQNTAIAALQSGDTTTNSAILALQNKTQNITTANTTSTNMNKPLYVTFPEAFRIYGNHGYISGWDSANNTRDWYFGTDFAGTKRIVLHNDKQDAIHIRSGSRTGNTNLGQNKIITHSNGISLRRGGITAGDNLLTVGEIGATGTVNTDATFYINGNATNNIVVDSGIGNITLKSNLINVGNGTDAVIIKPAGTTGLFLQSTNIIQIDTRATYIGSETVNPISGRKSNLLMLASDGTTWETQSSAFTETQKTQIATTAAKFTDASAFGQNKGRITMLRGFDLIGRPAGTSTLVANTVYTGTTNYNVGLNLQSLWSQYFAANGGFFTPEGPSQMNWSLSFELGFMCKNSTMRVLKTYIQVQNSAGNVIENTYTQGIHYRTAQTFNEIVYYNVGPLKHIISQGDRIFISTTYDFTTGSEGALTVMEGKFVIERNPL